MGVVVEEADETVYWLSVLHGSGLVSGNKLQELRAEAYELRAIFAASYRTARRRDAR